jgi:hypothetical protein
LDAFLPCFFPFDFFLVSSSSSSSSESSSDFLLFFLSFSFKIKKKCSLTLKEEKHFLSVHLDSS